VRIRARESGDDVDVAAVAISLDAKVAQPDASAVYASFMRLSAARSAAIASITS
jgi:hypothetical protein